MQIVSGGVTNVGRVRTNNEDSFRIVEPMNLYILSDGMGGEAHGEIASAMAVDVVAKHCAETEVDPAMTIFADMPSAWSEKTRRLSSAVHLANKSIFDSAQKHPEQRGMGATITAAWIDGTRLSIAHVGDSRAYLLRSGGLQQLTSDHSLVAEQVRRGILTPAEAERSDMQSVLLRALGAHQEIEVDSEEHTLFGGDVLLLCSDGLTRMITEPEIAGTLQAELDPTKASGRLVELANEQGGADNITAIVVRVGNEPKSWFSWLRGGQKKATAKIGTAGGK
ncbi:MAG: Stp1/IreP family PP2C-type Ser/Thr phosphatase [Acidobacteria bacterium]|nr:Stp1/IreP family PP2C-type Ser/Thr phosphatase [Acidobacteriota bacterium]